jgi:hypothetical protein
VKSSEYAAESLAFTALGYALHIAARTSSAADIVPLRPCESDPASLA